MTVGELKEWLMPYNDDLEVKVVHIVDMEGRERAVPLTRIFFHGKTLIIL